MGEGWAPCLAGYKCGLNKPDRSLHRWTLKLPRVVSSPTAVSKDSPLEGCGKVLLLHKLPAWWVALLCLHIVELEMYIHAVPR